MSESPSDSGLVEKRHVKTAFVSDIHLGSRYCQADRFLAFLEQHEIDELYLVGDFIDGWRLRSTWRWPAVYHRIFHRLLLMQSQGTKLYYTPGNHDEFLRHYMQDFGFVEIQDEFVHKAMDGRQFLVMHGDKFDEVEQQCQWLSVVGASLYEFLLFTNFSFNWIRKFVGMQEWHYSGAVKMKFKGAVNFISDFESKIANHARNRDCEAVICGHIHAPTVQKIGEITYCNTGDWVEHCTAIVEHTDGSWELTHHFDTRPHENERFTDKVEADTLEKSIAEECDELLAETHDSIEAASQPDLKADLQADLKIVHGRRKKSLSRKEPASTKSEPVR